MKLVDRLKTGVGPDGVQRLGAYGEVTTDGPWISIRGCQPEQVPDLVAAIVAGGGRIYAVEPGRETLEERFVELLGPETAAS